jgi:hypothetical protein
VGAGSRGGGGGGGGEVGEEAKEAGNRSNGDDVPMPIAREPLQIGHCILPIADGPLPSAHVSEDQGEGRAAGSGRGGECPGEIWRRRTGAEDGGGGGGGRAEVPRELLGPRGRGEGGGGGWQPSLDPMPYTRWPLLRLPPTSPRLHLIDHRPCTIDRRALTIDPRPSTIDHRTSIIDDGPATIVQPPWTSHHSP